MEKSRLLCTKEEESGGILQPKELAADVPGAGGWENIEDRDRAVLLMRNLKPSEAAMRVHHICSTHNFRRAEPLGAGGPGQTVPLPFPTCRVQHRGRGVLRPQPEAMGSQQRGKNAEAPGE